MLYSILFVPLCFYVRKASYVLCSIYRPSAWIAANLFKKKLFQIKTVNIAYVDFRFVLKKTVKCFRPLDSLQIEVDTNLLVWGFTFSYTVLGTRTTNQGKRAVFLTNQKRGKNRPYVRFPALARSSMFSCASCHFRFSRAC